MDCSRFSIILIRERDNDNNILEKDRTWEGMGKGRGIERWNKKKVRRERERDKGRQRERQGQTEREREGQTERER